VDPREIADSIATRRLRDPKENPDWPVNQEHLVSMDCQEDPEMTDSPEDLALRETPDYQEEMETLDCQVAPEKMVCLDCRERRENRESQDCREEKENPVCQVVPVRMVCLELLERAEKTDKTAPERELRASKEDRDWMASQDQRVTEVSPEPLEMTVCPERTDCLESLVRMV